jgi:hypothetical protein
MTATRVIAAINANVVKRTGGDDARSTDLG